MSHSLKTFKKKKKIYVVSSFWHVLILLHYTRGYDDRFVFCILQVIYLIVKTSYPLGYCIIVVDNFDSYSKW